MKKEDLERTTVLPKKAIEEMNAKEIIVYGSAIRFCFYEDQGNKKFHQSFEEWFFNLGFRKDRWQPVINSLIEKKYLTVNKEIHSKKSGKSWNEYWITMPQEGRDEYDDLYTFNGQDENIFKNKCEGYKDINISFFGGYVVVPFDFLTTKNISDVKKQCLIWLKSEKEMAEDIKDYKVHFKTIENITGLVNAKKYFNEMKKEGLIDYVALDANNKKTSRVENIKINFDAIINGIKKVVVAKNAPTETKEEVIMEVDYKAMLKEMEKEDQEAKKADDDFYKETFSEALRNDKISVSKMNSWVKDLQETKLSELYCNDEIEPGSYMYEMMEAL